MKRSKYSEEQIAYTRRQAESGTAVGDVCRQLGINETTFYARKKKYAHLGVNEVRRGEALDRVLRGPQTPRSITVDHGTEFQSRSLED